MHSAGFVQWLLWCCVASLAISLASFCVSWIFIPPPLQGWDMFISSQGLLVLRFFFLGLKWLILHATPVAALFEHKVLKETDSFAWKIKAVYMSANQGYIKTLYFFMLQLYRFSFLWQNCACGLAGLQHNQQSKFMLSTFHETTDELKLAIVIRSVANICLCWISVLLPCQNAMLMLCLGNMKHG